MGKREELAPYTLIGSLKQIGGDTLKDQVINSLVNEFVDPKYKEWLNGDLTPEQKDQLKAELEAKIDEAIGPLSEIMDAADKITPDELLKLEQQLTEWADGLIGDWLVEEIGEIEWNGVGISCDAYE